MGAHLSRQVLDLGLAKNDVGVAGWRLENIRGLDDEQDLRAKQSMKMASRPARPRKGGPCRTMHAVAAAPGSRLIQVFMHVANTAYIFALLDGHTDHAWHWLHAQLLHSLPALLLRAGLLATATGLVIIYK